MTASTKPKKKKRKEIKKKKAPTKPPKIKNTPGIKENRKELSSTFKRTKEEAVSFHLDGCRQLIACVHPSYNFVFLWRFCYAPDEDLPVNMISMYKESCEYILVLHVPNHISACFWKCSYPYTQMRLCTIKHYNTGLKETRNLLSFVSSSTRDAFV